MEPNAKLHLEFKKKKSGESYIARQSCQMPLQVFPAHHLEEDGSAFVYLLNPSSGMLEGDLFDIQFHLKECSQAVITTPSSNKIYCSKGAKTTQMVTANVEAGSVLEYIPEHNVPYKNSKFRQKSVFHVEKGGILFTWDVVMPGRIAREECFDFTAYQSDISLYYDGRLKLREGVKIIPEEFDPHNPAILEKYQIFTTMYLVTEEIPTIILEKVREYLQEKESVMGGISIPDEHVLVIKLLFEKNLGMQEVLWDIWNLVRLETLGKKACRIRKY